MIVRAEQTGDAPAIRAVVEAAFGQSDEADLVDRLRADGDAVLSMVAADGREIAGHLMLSRVRAPFPALGLAPVAVEPDRQRSGIGSALVRTALAEIAKSGWRAVFVLGDPGWYGRFGFEVGSAAGFTTPYAGPHFMALALDGPLPARHGLVGYAPAFEQLGR